MNRDTLLRFIEVLIDIYDNNKIVLDLLKNLTEEQYLTIAIKALQGCMEGMKEVFKNSLKIQLKD